jgi:hypothetical protein
MRQDIRDKVINTNSYTITSGPYIAYIDWNMTI